MFIVNIKIVYIYIQFISITTPLPYDHTLLQEAYDANSLDCDLNPGPCNL